MKGPIGHRVNEEVADNFFREGRQRSNPKLQVMSDFHTNTVGCLLERPNDVHPFGERSQMMKPDLPVGAIDYLFRCPRDWKHAATRRHHHHILLPSAREIVDVAIMREYFRP